MQQQAMVKSLNELLKHSVKGIEVFEELKRHLKSEQLMIELSEYIFDFHTHKQSLEGLIALFHGEVESFNIMDIMNEYLTKIQQFKIKDDVQVITWAIAQVQKQQEQIHEFMNQQDLNHDHVRKTCAIMIEDYQAIYHRLRKYQILFA